MHNKPDQQPRSADPHRFTDDYKIEADFRGETLHYLEGGRRTEMTWTWTDGYRVYYDSIKSWANSDGTTTPVSSEERAEIIHRVVKYAREVQHVLLMVCGSVV